MGSSILSEGCNHLDSQDGALQRYHYSLNRLPASRLLLPRSGLERSDFVQWPGAAGIWRCSKSAAIRGTAVVAPTQSERQPGPIVRRLSNWPLKAGFPQFTCTANSSKLAA